MATITLATLKTYWQNVSDWVKGTDAVSSPKVTVSAALPAGTNNIGDVDIASALPAGTNNIGDVDLASAIPAGTNIIGKVGIDQTTPGTTNGIQVNAALPAGDNNIGNVDVLTLPALATGSNIIGKVGIDQTTPGTTNGVQVVAALPAGTNNIGDVDVISLPALPAGTNNIGDVDVLTLPMLPAGTNNIGDVDVLTLPATNVEGTALASAARTATTSSTDIANNWGKGIHIILDVTAVNTSDVKVKVEGKDPASGKYYTILEGASVTAVSTNIYKAYPGLTAAANLVASDILPKTIRLTVTHANANSTTYSVGYSLV